ncbi:MAG: DUF2330 domain-containing protein [Minicystis sp.]
MRICTASLALAAATALAFATSSHDAGACGGFFSRRASPVPSLEVERVLLAWDRTTETEHFIRELTFQRADQPFGFVVPTPSRPEVAKVDDPPWKALHRAFPFEGLSLSAAGAGVGSGFGAGKGRVEVLEVKRVGSFTAFTLKADDAAALKQWLDKNQFTTRPSSEAWLAHYVRLAFHFVAFRYEPAAGGDRGTVHGETVRISFKTPAPYYPYLEPDADEKSPPLSDRVLSLWFVSQQPMTPITAVRTPAGVTWKKPWREGKTRFPVLESQVRDAVGPKLPLPRGLPLKIPLRDPEGRPQLVVEVFEDQKTSRRGFGDVLFVPEEPMDLDEAAVERRRALLPLLDPALEPTP